MRLHCGVQDTFPFPDPAETYSSAKTALFADPDPEIFMAAGDSQEFNVLRTSQYVQY
jgi:hypothetical protein